MSTDKIVTLEMLHLELKKILVEIALVIDKAKRDQDEKAREYRDDVLNKLDEVIGELDDHRIERLAVKNDVENLDKRVTKLENHMKAA